LMSKPHAESSTCRFDSQVQILGKTCLDPPFFCLDSVWREHTTSLHLVSLSKFFNRPHFLGAFSFSDWISCRIQSDPLLAKTLLVPRCPHLIFVDALHTMGRMVEPWILFFEI